MINAAGHCDAVLRQKLTELTEADRDYWSFKGNSRRENGHGLLQYPAMMVPQVARAVLEQVCQVHPEIESAGDPFVGSGTMLTESMMRGLAFIGSDINPLAILLCRVKSGPFFTEALTNKADELAARVDEDRRWAIEVSFTNRDKWFSRDVLVGLSKIRRAIRRENAPWARRFFWVTLAEVVRFASNSRTSTFKLHIREANDLATRKCDAIALFKLLLARNVQHFHGQAVALSEAHQLVRGHYMPDVALSLCDARHHTCHSLCDVIVTSPPYGDNATTVPYGQYSYLPLQWIDLEDIDSAADAECLASTHGIDSRSLGGSRRVAQNDSEHIASRSPTFARYVSKLRSHPRDRAQRIIAFFRDLDGCLAPILSRLRASGLMVWILGNRKVGGKRVPLNRIMTELLQAHGASLLCELSRRIPSKRMAPKNNIAETMSTEAILVMRKAT